MLSANFVSITTLGGSYYHHPHFTDRKTEAQRGEVASPGSPSLYLTKREFDAGLPNPKALALLFHLPWGPLPVAKAGARGELLPKSVAAQEMSSSCVVGQGLPSDPPRATLAV